MFITSIKFQISHQIFKQIKPQIQSENSSAIQQTKQYFDSTDNILSQNDIFISLDQFENSWQQSIEIPKLKIQEIFNIKHNSPSTPETIPLFEVLKSHKKIEKLILNKFDQSHINWVKTFKITQNIFSRIIKQDELEVEISLIQNRSKINNKYQEINQVIFTLKNGLYEKFSQYIGSWMTQYPFYLDQYSTIQHFNISKNTDINYPVQYQSNIKLHHDLSTEQAIRLIIQNTLIHLLPNLSAIAIGKYTSEHVHQARVAIRRMRSALQSFKTWANQIDPTWKIKLADLFRNLGSTRDLDALQESLIPKLEHAGAQINLNPMKGTTNSIVQIMRSSETTALVLALLNFINSSETLSNHSHQNLKKSALKQIQSLHEFISKNADKFSEIEIEKRHDIRKKIKRLRYILEFSASLFPKQEVETYLKYLKPAQEILGQYNDLFVAEELFKKQLSAQPELQFALGWIAAEKQHVLIQAQKKLKKLSRHKF